MGTMTKLQKAILAGDKDLLKVTDLPGIGPRIGRYMNDLGYYRVGDLRGADAAEMYTRHNILRGFEDAPAFCMCSVWQSISRKTMYMTRNSCAGGTGAGKVKGDRRKRNGGNKVSTIAVVTACYSSFSENDRARPW